jgi:molybdopterin-guanine dinucleotide biosynthesis protein A
MGRSKSRLMLGGTTFLERAVQAVRTRTQAVCLLGTTTVSLPPPPVDLIPDAPDVAGPMAGMLAAMRREPHACWLFIACDMPLVTPEAIDWLIGQRAPDRSAILPRLRTEGVEPLLALYEPPALALLESLAARGVASAQHIAADPSVATPTVPVHLRASWVNVNTPGEFDRIRRLTGT